ncbi:hypothetical protein LCGC14_0714560 [marine sediment metagenome]|uniref:Uncharacterized protein n=1 Tax=marine sediment metagenome TaxID=412755 RepID=A0A0F9QZJ2_9ZZZZ|nr:hypothetical protein [Phycisphaerae bacterium]
MGKIVEQIQVIDWTGVGTIDIDTDRVLDYIDVRNYRRALVIFNSPAGTAADDWNFTVRQADTISGGNVKDYDVISEYWTKQAATNLLSTEIFTRSTQTADALVSGDATSAEEVGLLLLDFDFTLMDTANGFVFLGGAITQDASNAAQVCACNLMLYEPRYPQAITVTAIA